ncbi:hydrogenase large subunit [Thermogemmatispora onikobensis]|uniref:hydrogenase large subunit n=1 Tax=Thermogemmatispora onikobensis TaxID=732234 RepID=UPI000853C2F0|nr:NADH-quinone oxidoreductase subunit C [Thermogemmatispora onikobensis]
MSELQILATHLAMTCGGVIRSVSEESEEIVLVLPVEALTAAIEALQRESQARFVDLFAVAGYPSTGTLQLHLLFALDEAQAWLHLLTELAQEGAAFPSLVDRLPATDWYERVVWEETGALPRGHPFLQRLRLPASWPERLWTQRADFSWSQAQPTAADEAGAVELEEAPPGVVDYPLGPVRSGVVESGHFRLRTVGEELVDVHLQLFYKHRGLEKRAEGLSPELLPLVAERITGTSAFSHSLALCQALERLAGVQVPLRARFLRTILGELERLFNHLGYQADLCQATGLVVAQAQFDILKERVLRLNAAISGHRYLFGMNVPGGLSRDLAKADIAAIEALSRECRGALEELHSLLLNSSSHNDRLEETGILPPDEARAYSVVGPIGRASGIDRDLRRDHPYAAYGEVQFEVPVLQKGDAFARSQIRLEEARQSLFIIEQALKRLPLGEVRVPMPPLPPGGSALGWAETPHGEAVHWLLVGEDATLRRYRVRPASFANWQAFPIAIPGHNILTDFPVIEQSFGLSIAGANS